jgi:uncharacterized protein (TIGR03382 family)
LLALLAACADNSHIGSSKLAQLQQDATVCGVGPTVKGIDVSYYQGTIDWSKVAGAGVKFAFIRASDGDNFDDPSFATYWSGSRAAGVIHGAYQFFRPEQDPIAQADLLLSKIGTLQPDDLPPVLDVEVADGVGASALAAGVKKWVDHVAAAIGRPPIIYTGYYFWQDSVGGADMTSSPLWHAQYTTASCPTIADPWTNWALWQYTSTGSVAGIGGSVDVDRWNGDAASLQAFLGPGGTCGDGTCNAGETPASCPEDCGPCATIDADGGIVDDNGACFTAGGPSVGMRHVTDAGEGGELYWTHTTAEATEENFGQWDLYFAEAGHYQVDVFTSAQYAQSKQAQYAVHTAGGDQEVTIDQTAADGWQSLGAFDFAQGGHQWVHLGDNTGEPEADNVQLVFDAVRVTRLDGAQGSGDGSDDGSSGSDVQPAPGKMHAGGCAAGGDGAGLAVAWLLVGLAGARRRRVSRPTGTPSP